MMSYKRLNVWYEPVASERNRHCGGKASSKSAGLSWVGFLRSRRYCGKVLSTRGSRAKSRPPKVLLLVEFFRWAPAPAVLLCKPHQNENDSYKTSPWNVWAVSLVNLAYYCGGEKTLSPPRFQHCGDERPRCPRGSDAFDMSVIWLYVCNTFSRIITVTQIDLTWRMNSVKQSCSKSKHRCLALLKVKMLQYIYFYK